LLACLKALLWSSEETVVFFSVRSEAITETHDSDAAGRQQEPSSKTSSICLSRDRSIASSKLSSPKSTILSLSPDEAYRIFFGERLSRKSCMW
jgi:hypothetical protein